MQHLSHRQSDEIAQLNVEIERLKKKCDDQALILRYLFPEKFPDTVFICGTSGHNTKYNVPEKILVSPAYGCDFFHVYSLESKTDD